MDSSSPMVTGLPVAADSPAPEQEKGVTAWVRRLAETVQQGAFGCNPTTTCQKVKDALPLKIELGITDSNDGVQLQLHLGQKRTAARKPESDSDDDEGPWVTTRPSTEDSKQEECPIQHPSLGSEPVVLSPNFIRLPAPAPTKKAPRRRFRRRDIFWRRAGVLKLRALPTIVPEDSLPETVPTLNLEEQYWKERGPGPSRSGSVASRDSGSDRDVCIASQLCHANGMGSASRKATSSGTRKAASPILLSPSVPTPMATPVKTKKPSSRLGLRMPNLIQSVRGASSQLCEECLKLPTSMPPLSLSALTTELAKYPREADLDWKDYLNMVTFPSDGPPRLKPTMTVYANQVVLVQCATIAGVGPSRACVTRRMAEEISARTSRPHKPAWSDRLQTAFPDTKGINAGFLEQSITQAQPRLLDQLLKAESSRRSVLKIQSMCPSDKLQMFGYWPIISQLKSDSDQFNVRMTFVGPYLVLLATKNIEGGSDLVILSEGLSLTHKFGHICALVQGYPRLGTPKRSRTRREVVDFYRSIEFASPEAEHALRVLLDEVIPDWRTVGTDEALNS